MATERTYNGFIISDDPEKLSLDRICAMLATTYWADKRSRGDIEGSMSNSANIGVYDSGGYMVGYARLVTDRYVMYWLCDVIIDEKYRGKGLGKALMKYITELPPFDKLRGILGTRDAHGLYEQFGFVRDPERFMRRFPVE